MVVGDFWREEPRPAQRPFRRSALWCAKEQARYCEKIPCHGWQGPWRVLHDTCLGEIHPAGLDVRLFLNQVLLNNPYYIVRITSEKSSPGRTFRNNSFAAFWFTRIAA